MNQIIYIFTIVLISYALTGCSSGDFEVQDKGDSPDISEPSDQTTPLELKVQKDVIYQATGNWDPAFSKLDVFYSNQDANQGILIYVHGGSWQSGDKASYPEMSNFAEFFIDKGYVVASINYRLLRSNRAPGATYQDQASDIASATKYMIENASNYNASNGDVILYGHSSGAHMTALIATDDRYLNQFGLELSNLKAVISSDVHNYNIPWAIKQMVGTRYEANIPALTEMFGETLEEQLAASPGNYMNNPNTPPMLLMSAGYDQPGASYDGITNWAQENFTNRLKDFGHSAWHYHFEEDTHSGMLLGFGSNTDPQTQAVEDFLTEL